MNENENEKNFYNFRFFCWKYFAPSCIKIWCVACGELFNKGQLFGARGGNVVVVLAVVEPTVLAESLDDDDDFDDEATCVVVVVVGVTCEAKTLTTASCSAVGYKFLLFVK